MYNESINTNNKIISTDLFNYIKASIYEAPEKYDYVVKNKSKICFSYTSALGNIVGIVLSTILICLPSVFSIVTSRYWILYPICCLILGYFMGTIIFSNTMNNLYKNIDMEKSMMVMIQIHLNRDINQINKK